MNSLIGQYIDKLTIDNINDFGTKNNIFLSKKELEVLFDIVKNHYEEVLYQDDSIAKKRLKENLTADNYQKIITMYEKYRQEYGRYLL